MEIFLISIIVLLIGCLGITIKFALDCKAVAQVNIVECRKLERKLWNAENEAYNWEWISGCMERDLEACRKTVTVELKDDVWTEADLQDDGPEDDAWCQHGNGPLNCELCVGAK